MKRSLGFVLVSVLLFGCVPPYAVVAPGGYVQSDAFQTGDFRLPCGDACRPAWASNLDRLVSLYNTGQWQELAASVMQIGYENDMAYFLLGSAAEGLGYSGAAARYYQYASALHADGLAAHHCRESGVGCGGLDLDALLQAKMKAFAAPGPQTAQLSKEEHDELQSLLSVVHAAEVCHRTIPSVVNEEIAKYLDYYKLRLQYEKFSQEDAEAAALTDKRGKKQCSNGKERKKFDAIINGIKPFAKVHPEAAGTWNAAATYYQGVTVPPAQAVEVPYVYYTGFWWGSIWYPGGYYDPYWRYYGWWPGPRFVFRPGYGGFWGFPGYYGYRGFYGYHGSYGYHGYYGHPGYSGYPGSYGRSGSFGYPGGGGGFQGSGRFGGSFRGGQRYR